MSQVPVKWVPEVCMLDARQGQAKTPVVPLSSLREVVEGLGKQATNDQFDTGLEAQAYHLALSDLLASLGEVGK